MQLKKDWQRRPTPAKRPANRRGSPSNPPRGVFNPSAALNPSQVVDQRGTSGAPAPGRVSVKRVTLRKAGSPVPSPSSSLTPGRSTPAPRPKAPKAQMPKPKPTRSVGPRPSAPKPAAPRPRSHPYGPPTGGSIALSGPKTGKRKR